MINSRLKNLLTDYTKRMDIAYDSMRESELFERFSADVVFRGYHRLTGDQIQNNTLVGGGPNDGSIDGVAILVNRHPVNCIPNLPSGSIKVEFAFIQAKTGQRFSSTDISNFYHGVKQFFSDDRPTFHDNLEQFSITARHILRNRYADLDGDPACRLYYVAAGDWQNPEQPSDRFLRGDDELMALGHFSDVKGRAIDFSSLRKINLELRSGIKRKIRIRNKVGFPTQIDNVKDAYIGLIAGDQFIKLVSTDDCELNTDLFYRNVRDFQGHNNVNNEIANTLHQEKQRVWFPLLNNGITLVADELHDVKMSDEVELSNFQIVNGCQTTHMFFNTLTRCECISNHCKCHQIQSQTLVPIKIVVTDDDKLIDEVIKATNNQTKVEPIMFEALDDFHVELEEYYRLSEASVEEENRFHYERRKGQYRKKSVSEHQIIGLETQVQSFVAMFLNRPHLANRSYVELLETFRDELFYRNDDTDMHDMTPYYACGVALRIVERMIRKKELEELSWFNRFSGKTERCNSSDYRYQLLMLLREQISGPKVPDFKRQNKGGIEPYSQKIIDRLRNSEGGIRECRIALQRIGKVLGDFDRPSQRLDPSTEEFTRLLLDRPRQQHIPIVGDLYLDDRQKESGTIMFFDNWKEYGFIDRDGIEDNLYLPRRSAMDIPVSRLQKGQRVRYKVGQGKERGKIEAREVELA